MLRVCFPDLCGLEKLRERVQWLVALKWCGQVGPGPICLLASLGPAGPRRILTDTRRCENPPGGHWVPVPSCFPGGHLRPGAPVLPAHCWSACWGPSPVTHPAWSEEAAHSPGPALARGVRRKSAPSETLPAASQSAGYGWAQWLPLLSCLGLWEGLLKGLWDRLCSGPASQLPGALPSQDTFLGPALAPSGCFLTFWSLYFEVTMY